MLNFKTTQNKERAKIRAGLGLKLYYKNIKKNSTEILFFLVGAKTKDHHRANTIYYTLLLVFNTNNKV